MRSHQFFPYRWRTSIWWEKLKIKKENFMRRLVSILFLIIFIDKLFALTFTATVDRNTLSLDEQLTLQVSISGNVSSIPTPKIPAFDGFTAYSSGRSQNISIINGKVTSSVIFTYILVPQRVGTFTIPPITLKFKGKTLSTQPITVKVTASQQKTTVPFVPKGGVPSDKPQITKRKDIFITVSVDKTKAFVNQQITLTFRFYRKAGINLLSQPYYSPPDTTGFWKEDLPPQRTYNTVIDGVRYVVTEIKTALFPISSGRYKIGSAQLECKVEDFSTQDFFSDDFFRSFFSEGKRKVLHTQPIIINVLPLPKVSKPKGFTGAVGEYKVSMTVDKNQGKVNEPITLSVKISGLGNIKTVSLPPLKPVSGFKKYETVSSFNIQKQNYIVGGSKVYKTILVPQTSGKLTIPGIEFSYFNPKTKTYRVLKTAPLDLNILPSEKKVVSAPVYPGLSPSEVKVFKGDIRFIKTKFKLKSQSTLMFSNFYYLFAHMLGIMGLFLFWMINKRKEVIKKDMASFRIKKASSEARKRLKNAYNFLNIKKKNEFYQQLTEALLKYISDKLTISIGTLTTDVIEKELIKKNIPEELINHLKELLQKADFARFAPSQIDINTMKNDFSFASEVITKLERYL